MLALQLSEDMGHSLLQILFEVTLPHSFDAPTHSFLLDHVSSWFHNALSLFTPHTRFQLEWNLTFMMEKYLLPSVELGPISSTSYFD